MDTLTAKQLLLSLVLGLLVGLQREKSHGNRGGIRTFPLVSLFGTLCGYLAATHGSWILFGGLIVVAAGGILPDVLAAIRHTITAVRESSERRESELNEIEFGQTTFMATLLVFTVGALLSMESMLVVAIAVGGGAALLLQLKPEFHRAATILSDADMKAMMQFVLITCIILPVVPNRTLGPYDVFNPFEAWLMVVLIVGMGLLGYLISLFWGEGAGSVLAGLLGGAVSSTATTVSVCQRSSDATGLHGAAALTIAVASTVSFVRVLIELFVVSPEFAWTCVMPLGVMLGLMLVAATLWWSLGTAKEPCDIARPRNPAHLKTAVTFGVLYSVLLIALAAVREQVRGHGTLMLLAAVSGMTDMDAITLSTARMAALEQTPAAAVAADMTAATDVPAMIMMHDGWRLIVAASLGGLFFKAMIVAAMAGRGLFTRVAIIFALSFLGGAVLLLV